MNSLNYYPLKTLMHKVDVRVKMIALLAMTVMIFLCFNITSVTFVLAIGFLLAFLSKLPLRTMRNIFISIVITFVVTLFFNWWVIGPPTGVEWQILHYIGNTPIYTYTYVLTTVITGKIWAMLMFASIFTWSTQQQEMSYGINFLLYPLKYLKVPTNEIALLITMGIRFIPQTLFEIKTIFNAETSRGLSVQSSNPKEKWFAFKNMFLPLFVNNFKKVDDINSAMLVRGYKIGEDRTTFYKKKLGWSDLIFFLIISASLAMVIVMLTTDFPFVLDPIYYNPGIY